MRRRRLLSLALAAALACAAAPPAVRAGNDGLELYGDIGQIAIPVLAGGLSLYKEDYEGVAMLATGTGLTMGTVFGLKYAVNTERPDGGSRSFPSGHTAGAFAGASYLHYRYGWKWGLPAYAAASIVGYSRVDADKHYWYDVVAGAAIANLFAYVVTDTYDEDVVIVPILDLGKKNFGLLARFEF